MIVVSGQPNCYGACEALYHALGGKDAGLTPMQIEHEGESHWYLRWDVDHGDYIERLYIDPTSTQFESPVPYHEGRGRGFQTKEPSAKARPYIKENT